MRAPAVIGAFVALLPVEGGGGSFFLELGKIIINLARWLTGLSLVGAGVTLVGRGILLLELLLEINMRVLDLVVGVDAGGGQLQSTREVLEPIWMRLSFSYKTIFLYSSLSAITLHGLGDYSMNTDIIHDTFLSANNSRMPLLINLKVRVLIDPLL